jgi:hypothetical protein
MVGTNVGEKSETELSRDFGSLIEFTKANVLPKPFANQLMNDFKFFRDQSIQHPDVKLNAEFLSKRWAHLEEAVRGTDLLRRFEAHVKNWSAIEKFVKAKKLSADIIPLNNKSLDWDVEKLLHHFFVNAQKMPQFRGQEKSVVLLGLKYLIAEAGQPKVRRDRVWIAQAWTALHPLLEREGMLAPFKNETIVRERLKAFVRGSS